MAVPLTAPRAAGLVTRPAGPTMDRLPHPVSAHGHPRGKLSSWLLVSAVLLAFAVGGIALILHLYVLMAVCGAVVLAAIPVGRIIHIMSDTVGWTGPAPTRVYPGHIVREACHIHDGERRAA